MENANLGRELPCPPSDGITKLRYFNGSNKLIASSWNGTVGLYSSSEDKILTTFLHSAPVLDAAIEDDLAILSAGLDGKIKRFDIESSTEQSVGSHDKAVKCVEWLLERQLVASASWDGSLKVWDVQDSNAHEPVVTIPLPGKAFAMSASGNTLAVATSKREILAFDIRRLEGGQPFLQRESSLKFQTRCLQCFSEGEGYAISSVEGRVAIEYFDSGEESQAKKFAFKCHRRKEGGEDTAYPVNAIAFQPVYGTFATGGCDGAVNVWDKDNKKRLTQLPGYPTSIASLSFNQDGTQLAIAASYTFEKGEMEHPSDGIYVRDMLDSEVRPKSRR